MVPREALAELAKRLEPWRPRVALDVDDFGDALVCLRLDMTHLDADALNDRLHAWAVRVVQPEVPGASAFVSFRHARPATPHEADLDVEEEWRDLEPTFRLELHAPPARPEHVARFADLVPAFLAQVFDRAGRPEGWRDVEAGNAE